jgi:hypothetical protein
MSILAALTEALVTSHALCREKTKAYLAVPLDDPDKADAYLTMCEACRKELEASEALLAERERILAKA